MAWSAPFTAVTGNVFTASQFNQYVRDNLNMTAPVVAATAGNLIVTLGSKVVGERIPDVVFLEAEETTTSTSYVDLATAGPAITAVTGTKALVSMGGMLSNNTAGLGSRMGVAISGATTTAAADAQSYYIESGNVSDAFKGTWVTIFTLTAGTNTFTTKYRTTAGGGTSTFSYRLLTVIPF